MKEGLLSSAPSGSSLNSSGMARRGNRELEGVWIASDGVEFWRSRRGSSSSSSSSLRKSQSINHL